MLRLKVTFDKSSYEKQTKKEVTKLLELTSEEILEVLQYETPKDTGAAANSWEVSKKSNKGFEITNDKEYVKYLNAGSSRQAPARFIEAVALSYGTPIGNVVDYE